MSSAALKSHLHQLINGINDDSRLQAIYVMLTEGKMPEPSSDWFDQLPPKMKARLLESMRQAENGETTSHDSVMLQLAEKYPNLRFK